MGSAAPQLFTGFQTRSPSALLSGMWVVRGVPRSVQHVGYVRRILGLLVRRLLRGLLPDDPMRPCARLDCPLQQTCAQKGPRRASAENAPVRRAAMQGMSFPGMGPKSRQRAWEGGGSHARSDACPVAFHGLITYLGLPMSIRTPPQGRKPRACEGLRSRPCKALPGLPRPFKAFLGLPRLVLVWSACAPNGLLASSRGSGLESHSWPWLIWLPGHAVDTRSCGRQRWERVEGGERHRSGDGGQCAGRMRLVSRGPSASAAFSTLRAHQEESVLRCVMVSSRDAATDDLEELRCDAPRTESRR